MACSPAPRERFLRQVFALRNVPAHSVSQTANRGLIPRDQLPKRVTVPVQNLRQQGRIVQGCNIRHDIQFHIRLTSGPKLETVTGNLWNKFAHTGRRATQL
ncbi:MAG TPA: hypothetical protein VH595_03440 [Verrucomicrobiae bacterium]|jgi:hypothetical protein|nr:hypothetical protein [Verrucomicrobiae bacterium]